MLYRTLISIITFILNLLVAPLAAAAPPPAKVARIGVLTLGTAPSTSRAEAFRQGLKEHGYVEGQNIAVEYRYAEGKADRLPALTADLVRLQVDILVTESNVAALAAKQATHTIPIVAIAGDLAQAGVVDSLARPGGNVTGLTMMHPELSGKRLELLKEAVPTLDRIAVLWNPTDPPAAAFMRETEAAARALGLQLHAIEARTSAELEAAFQTMADMRPSAFFTLGGAMFQDNMRRIVAFATQARLPGVYPNRPYAEAGGLMSYGPNLDALFRRAAVFVDKILQGAKPADLPVEQPTQFELVLNLKTAQAFGITIPPALLLLADEVIR